MFSFAHRTRVLRRTRLSLPAALMLAGSAYATPIVEEPFSSIHLYTLKNKNGLEVKITNYGAIITSLKVPDRNGKLGDIVLGYDSVEQYICAVARSGPGDLRAASKKMIPRYNMTGK